MWNRVLLLLMITAAGCGDTGDPNAVMPELVLLQDRYDMLICSCIDPQDCAMPNEYTDGERACVESVLMDAPEGTYEALLCLRDVLEAGVECLEREMCAGFDACLDEVGRSSDACPMLDESLLQELTACEE